MTGANARSSGGILLFGFSSFMVFVYLYLWCSWPTTLKVVPRLVLVCRVQVFLAKSRAGAILNPLARTYSHGCRHTLSLTLSHSLSHSLSLSHSFSHSLTHSLSLSLSLTLSCFLLLKLKRSSCAGPSLELSAAGRAYKEKL